MKSVNKLKSIVKNGIFTKLDVFITAVADDVKKSTFMVDLKLSIDFIARAVTVIFAFLHGNATKC